MSGFKNVRTLTLAALITAIGIITTSLKIPISTILEIRISSLPLAVAGYLFGPGIAAVIGIISDIGGFLIWPTGPYFPGFTFSAAISGIIFGTLLHKKDGSFPGISRVILAVVINTVLVNLLLHSLWLTLLYGKGGFVAVMSARLIKELVMIPIYIILIIAVIKPLEALLKRHPITDNREEVTKEA